MFDTDVADYNFKSTLDLLEELKLVRCPQISDFHDKVSGQRSACSGQNQLRI